MPYDPGLAERLQEHLCERPGMSPKKMFGGIGWLLNGNMCVGVYQEWLIIRVGVEAAKKVFADAHTKPMDITGKAMKGWAMVGPEGVSEDEHLERYLIMAIDFVQTLPPKE